jgi:hypothetical protein
MQANVKYPILLHPRLQDGKSEKYCKCGELLQEYKSNYHLDMPYCGNCDSIIYDLNQNFCGNCGVEIDTDDTIKCPLSDRENVMFDWMCKNAR